MRRKIIYKMIFLLLLLLFFCFGCGKDAMEEDAFFLFYWNKECSKLVPVEYELEQENTEDKVDELLTQLMTDTKTVDYRKPAAGEVEILSWSLQEKQLRLNFNSAYSKMDRIMEVLCRAAFVRTLIQLPEIQYISFYVADAPLTDADGNPVGIMTAESFIENPGEQINSIQTAEITLYFADKEGTSLVSEVRECHYSSNISIEKLVMEELLKGPEQKGSIAAVPSGTKLLSVSVLDGVCFVNLDAGFLNHNYEIKEEVVIYSIVNSLVEIAQVNKVQISVNGDTSKIYREKCSLATLYERNLDYVKEEK